MPLWLIGAVTGLPISVLNAFNPLIAACILTYREHGSYGVKELLKRSADFGKIKKKIWYVPIFGLLPTTYVLIYGLMYVSGASLPDQQTPILLAPVFFVVFFVLAIGEEVGWSGYAIEPLQKRWNALNASLIVGIVWAIWHILPDIQAHHALTWIAWQRLYTVLLRILIVWLFYNTGKSVFAAIVFHATDNVCFVLFPNYGSHYDPFFTCLITAFTAAIVILVWGPETLARYRYARLSGSDIKK